MYVHIYTLSLKYLLANMFSFSFDLLVQDFSLFFFTFGLWLQRVNFPHRMNEVILFTNIVSIHS